MRSVYRDGTTAWDALNIARVWGGGQMKAHCVQHFPRAGGQGLVQLCSWPTKPEADPRAGRGKYTLGPVPPLAGQDSPTSPSLGPR